MAQQQSATPAAGPGVTAASSTDTSLYPVLDSTISPLSDLEKSSAIARIEKKLVISLRDLMPTGNVLDGVGDRSILPVELISSGINLKPKIDPLKRLKELPTEEAEEEEEQEDEEEDEEQEAVEDEEDDAGGDYLVSHFDNGENYEDNDDEGDDMSGMM